MTIAEVTGRHELLRFGARPYRDGERFHWRAATAHAEAALGWRARTPLAEGLRRTIDFERGALAREAA
jgi:nucleoside-diphosphate-sugar epimerase